MSQLGNRNGRGRGRGRGRRGYGGGGGRRRIRVITRHVYYPRPSYVRYIRRPRPPPVQVRRLPRVHMILGTTCSGKSYFINRVVVYRVGRPLRVVSADGVFADMVKEQPNVAYSQIKPLVRPRMLQIIHSLISRGNTVIVDDNTTSLVELLRREYGTNRVQVTLLFMPLDRLLENAMSRPAGDQRPLAGILMDFLDFYTTTKPRMSSRPPVSTITSHEIERFLAAKHPVTHKQLVPLAMRRQLLERARKTFGLSAAAVDATKPKDLYVRHPHLFDDVKKPTRSLAASTVKRTTGGSGVVRK